VTGSLRFLPCLTCDKDINVDTDAGESFNYDKEGGGPFCPLCWWWQQQIDLLQERVAELERKSRSLKTEPNPRPSLDVRGHPKGSRGPGCPHRPQYRHCWCK
jgi:hypothetical protein